MSTLKKIANENAEKMLREGVAALNLALTESQIAALLAFVALLEKWNKAYNLTAIKNSVDMTRLHLLDSLAVAPFLEGRRVLDVGTGAGLPGIPLAIAYPEYTFVLLDSNAKKTRFVQQAILELQLSHVSVQHCRVEDYAPEQLFDTVLTRAFASLPAIVSVTAHLLNENGALLAMKGQTPEDEWRDTALNPTIIPLQVPNIEAERCLVRIKKCHDNES